MNTLPIMPLIFLALLLLPIKLSPRQLTFFAFALWVVGGAMLSFRGLWFLQGTEASLPVLAGFVVAAVAIGVAKGKFVLTKTSQRNIERLSQMTQPHRPIFVYSARSWIIIGVMVLISLSLTWFNLDLLWRGAVNLGIGLALVVSSLAYVRAIKQQPAA